MKFRSKTLRYAETALILFVWIVLLATPVLFREGNNIPVEKSVLNQLEILIPLTILLLINRLVLVPRLLFRRKPVGYVASVLGVILVLATGIYIYSTKIKKIPPERKAGSVILPARGDDRPVRPGPSPGKRSGPVPPYANFLIFSVLVAGFDTGLRSGMRWIVSENEKVNLEKENVANQLTMLKSQVSPHFFMNTLNNIHALIDTDTEEAKEAIIKLSKMMRYLLYETESEKTTLKKEVEFIESYVNLMKLRYTGKVRIILNLPAVIPDASIPPFLFTSFIENAFKHGISYQKESFIIIDLIPGSNRLLMIVKNSKNEKNDPDGCSGIGIENTRKRLALLFGTNYHLDIIDNEDIFTVNLSIPV